MSFFRGLDIRLYQEDLDTSTDSPVEPIRKIAESEVKKQRTLELAIVSNIYPHASSGDSDNYQCDVKLKNGASELRRVPILAPHIGFAHVPNIGDLVLIGYIGGSVNSPIVVGSLYNDEQRPPPNNAGEIIFESPDSANSSLKRLYLKFPGGIELTVKDDVFKIDTGQATLEIQTSGNFSLKSSGYSITGDSSNLDIKASGAMLTVSSNGGMKIKSSGMLDIEGSVVNIKGGTVNIN